MPAPARKQEPSRGSIWTLCISVTVWGRTFPIRYRDRKPSSSVLHRFLSDHRRLAGRITDTLKQDRNLGTMIRPSNQRFAVLVCHGKKMESSLAFQSAYGASTYQAQPHEQPRRKDDRYEAVQTMTNMPFPSERKSLLKRAKSYRKSRILFSSKPTYFTKTSVAISVSGGETIHSKGKRAEGQSCDKKGLITLGCESS